MTVNANLKTRVDIKVLALTGTETLDELTYLKLAAKGNTKDTAAIELAIKNYADALGVNATSLQLAKANAALADYSSQLNIGSITTTQRNSLPDGRVLLPLNTRGRILTADEEELYPELSQVLPNLPAMTQQGTVGIPYLTLTNPEAQEFAVVVDGSKFYYGKNNFLYSYNRATDTATLEFSGGSSDDITAVRCSADGVIVAFVQWDSSNSNNRLWVSVNSGSTFTNAGSSSGGCAIADDISLHVAPNGSTITCLMSDASANYRYLRIDNPAANSAVDVNKMIHENLSVATSTTLSMYASFTDDGLTMVVSYDAGNGTDEKVVEYSEDAGDTFTRINAHPFDQVVTTSTMSNVIVVLDPNNPTNLLALLGGTYNAGVFHSEDKGITWKSIPAPAENVSGYTVSGSDNGGWSQWSNTLFKPRYRNGIVTIKDGVGFHYVVHISLAGQVSILDKVKPSRDANQGFFSVGWAADEQSFAVSGIAANDYPWTGTIFTVGKYVPSALLHSNTKLVADAP
ncbi:hypothetical protein A9Q74_06345 [Colwellia sp. 39_35_sub15_T18]|nr:hypothetical protein A9Q74_06345 [Colwellia sp. 39_35_sub15_T18]